VNDQRATNRMRLIPIFAVLSLAFCVAGSTKAAFSAGAQETVFRPTTAWRDGKFNIDARGVVSRSNIILQRPNLQRVLRASLRSLLKAIGEHWRRRGKTQMSWVRLALPLGLWRGLLHTSACVGNRCCLLSLETRQICSVLPSRIVTAYSLTDSTSDSYYSSRYFATWPVGILISPITRETGCFWSNQSHNAVRALMGNENI
jgi:hypothetical protein